MTDAPNRSRAAPRPGRGFSFSRVGAMMLRHWYLLSSSWPRTIELIYWPAVQLMTWGFVQLYVQNHSSFFSQAAGTFVGGVLLWDVLLRGQQGFAFSFLEEMWSRNLGNLLMSPLKPSEFVVSLMIMSVVRLSIGIIPVTFLAIPLFGFNIWGLGLPLAAFFANLLLFGWAIGIVVAGILLRQGMGAENIAWSLMFLIMPLTCVYYPAATLPWFVQPFAWALPTTYVFEGMRAILIDGRFRADLMIGSFALNAVYMALGIFAFFRLLAAARRAGSLLQQGE